MAKKDKHQTPEHSSAVAAAFKALPEIEARLKAITPGLWVKGTTQWGGHNIYTEGHDATEEHEVIEGCEITTHDGVLYAEDAEFAAQAPEDIRLLCAALRSLGA